MPSQDPNRSLALVTQAVDTEDFLDHIAWTNLIHPKLLQAKENYAKILVAHLLGAPLPTNITKEQLAGKIYGIDFIISLIANILRNGSTALDALESQGIHISS